MELSIIGYDPAGAWRKAAATVDELLTYRNSAGVTWINVDGLDNPDAINRLAEIYHIHPLTVEDILNFEERPKVEEFEQYLFITLKAIRRQAGGEPIIDQIGFALLEDTLITFQEIPGDTFDGIRRRILYTGGKIRRMGPDYLAYILIDAIVDEYFLVIDALEARMEDFEDRAPDEKDALFITDLQKLKQTLIRVRRAVWPLRESLAALIRMDSSKIHDDLDPFLRDLQGNVIQAAEAVETTRELIAGVLEVRFSTTSIRTNKVMSVLTIISTIFIPLTFIVGVYGMNFQYMPELAARYGYPIVWGCMILIALGMLFFFKRRRWF
ncbi:MAG: magnesium/cobalt transporter CorA [Treponema sp.]|jgi:magnesium transporter|nr:magnesium/cobalt transporter CorA [Treponema sp.]